MRPQSLTGAAAIALAIGFNIPYATLAVIFEYPAILRRPAADVLQRFADGGPTLVLARWSFMLSALLLAPLAVALAVTPERARSAPALAIGAAVSGALAGVVQAIGLARWVFAVPMLAQDPAGGARGFELLNAYGGVAIGEHVGQLLTGLFVAQLAMLQARDGAGRMARIGFATAAAIVLGTGEGLAIALGVDGGRFAIFTIAGFLGLSLWLLLCGLSLLRMSAPASPARA